MVGDNILEKLLFSLEELRQGKLSKFQIGSRSYDLVFAGGGSKGLVHVGALMELEARGMKFRRFVGTSAGAILAALLAAGYSAEEIFITVTQQDDAGNLPFASFLDVPSDDDFEIALKARAYTESTGISLRLNERILGALEKLASYRQLVSFVQYGGVYAGDQFLSWMNDKLNANGRNLGHTTLAEFHRRTGREFTAVATDTFDRVALALNHRTAPDVPVVWAVRMSMSIPFVWKEVLWRPGWGRYRGKDIHGHTIVDGGVISNFPLYLVLSKDQDVINMMGAVPDPKRVIGLLIDDQLPLPGENEESEKMEMANSPIGGLTPPPWRQVENRITNLISTMTRASDNAVAYAHPENVCRLPAKGYGTLEFDMSEERIHTLVTAGRQSIREFLEEIGT